MKKIAAFFLLLWVTTVFVAVAQAQSRPRRANPSGQGQQQTPAQPSDPVDQSRRPPVLGGANRDPNEQKPSTAPQNNGPEEVGQGEVIRVSTTLVSIPVSVMDRDGKYIPNLRKDDFRIWEDGVEQQVGYFGSVEKPFTVALMLDTSGSMGQKVVEIQNAAIEFVSQLRPEDSVMVLSFDDRIRVLAEPTNDRYVLQDAIRRARGGQGTRLYDAVAMVENRYLNHIQGRKAVVLFTDGVDTTSRNAKYEGTVRDAEELDALIYTIEYDTYEDVHGRYGGWPGTPRYPRGGGIWGIILGGPVWGGGPGGGGGGGRGSSREEYERGDRYLQDLSRVTGARCYKANDTNLSEQFHLIAEELRRQYTLGYYPKRTPQPGERRSIKVRVNRPELVVRARESYIFQQSASNTSQQTIDNQQPPVLKRKLTEQGWP
jgi:Ca-activated chloride channel homolog